MGLNRIGRAIKATGAMKCWKDGDGVAFIWRWWHPLSWVLIPLMLIASVLFSGIPETWNYREDLGLRLSDYWRERKDKREFI
jgi:hypothetical protein